MKKQLLALTAGLMAVAGVRAQCSPISAPFLEDFTSNSVPTCWSTYQTQGSGWVFNGNPGYNVSGTADHTGGVTSSNFAWIDFSVPDEGTCLESPEIDVTSVVQPSLRFWHISNVTTATYLNNMGTYNELFIEAWNGTSWVQVAMEQGQNGSAWTEYLYDLTPYIYGSNLIKFRFRGEPTNTTYAYYNDLLLDDVEIFDGSTYCFAPTNFQITGATANTADLDWDGSGTDYIIEYGAPGFTPGTGTFQNVTGGQTAATVNGLTAGNTYDFYVYQNCVGLSDTSNAVGPLTETAQCSPVLDMQVTAAGTSTADLTWTSSGANFIVEYGAQGFNPGSGMSAPVTSATSQQLTSLTSNQFYEAYVRVICGPGDTSTYFGPVIFNTYGLGQFMDWDNSCSPLGFVDISGTGTDLGLVYYGEATITSPFDIVFQNTLAQDITVGNNGGVQIGVPNAQIGAGGNFGTLADGMAFLWGDALDEETGNVYWQVVGTAPNRTLIIHWHNICNVTGTPTSPTVDFQMQIFEATQEIFYVYNDVVFGGSNASDDYAGNADIGISGPEVDYTISVNDTEYLENNSCVRFFYTNCPNVQDLQVITYDYNQIGLTWNPGYAGETNWTIEWGPAGFTPGSGLGTMTTTNNFDTITGLTQLTDYDVYVYADCNLSTSLSSEGIYVSHQTAPECANPFGLGASGSCDSIFASWNWQPTAGTGMLATNFNITYVPSGQSVYGSTGTEVNTGSASFSDTIFDATLIASGVYDVYVQSVCNTGDTSIYVGPVNYLGCMSNDSSCFAQDLPVNDQPYTLYNNGAQNDPGIQAIAPQASGFNTTDGWGNGSVYRSTWYTFTAPASGDVKISGTDVNYYSKMAVYETTNCGDFNQYNLIGANDNGVLFGNTNAAEWVVCGLTPGQTYYLLHSAQYSYTAAGIFSIRLTELDFEAGTSTGIVDACLGDTANLFNTITGYDTQYGNWNDLANTAQLSQDSLFSTGVLASQVYNFEYRVQLGCSFDSIIGQVEIYPPSSAGNNGSIDVCLNEPINLVSGLSGNADLGGTWYDPFGNAVNVALPFSGTVPGQFNYDYVTGNGVCPDDTALVLVVVDGTCDWLSTEDVQIEGISVYPNPANDVLNIQSVGSHDALKAQMIDVNGRIVATANEELVAGESVTLSVDNLETGVYILKLYNGSVENTFRVVIQ